MTEFFGGLFTLPLAICFAPLTFGPAEQTGWIYISIHSVMFYVVAIALLYASLDGIPGWLSSALRATGPAVAAPVGWVFFGERLDRLQIVGAAIVLLTSALITRRERKLTASSLPSNGSTSP